MMKIKTILTIFIALIVLPVWAQNPTADELQELNRIKQQYKALLIPNDDNDSLKVDLMKIAPEKEMGDQLVIELHQRYPADMAVIAGYLKTLLANGSWPDINYQSKRASGWEPRQHADRIWELTRVYSRPSSPYYQKEEVKTAIHKALKFWYDAKLVSTNWWPNQIGVPKTLGGVFLVLENELSSEEMIGAIEVMNKSKFGMTGQNKVWLAGNVLIRGLLQKDYNLVKQARDIICSEIAITGKDGIQADWSYHQHGPQLQFGNYGMAFISSMTMFASMFEGTSLAFTKDKMDILTSLIDKGYRWVIWNRMMDVSSLARQIYHNAQYHKAYTLAFSAENLGLKGFPTNANPLVGHKHFYASDYTVHRMKNWMATVKMCSTRVNGSEHVNEDNIYGYYLGDGATYYYQRGDEYLNVFPFWDWRKIPGVTAYEDDKPMPPYQLDQNKSAMVGGLDADRCGMTAMELKRDGLTAHKTWLMTEDYVLCLGGAIQSDSSLVVTTAIEQKVKKGDLELYSKGWKPVTAKQTFSGKDIRFYHDGSGYVVLNGQCAAESGQRKGNWHDFMGVYKPTEITGDVTALTLYHGTQPHNASYEYFVLPASTKEKVQTFKPKDIRIVRNDAEAQVIATKKDGKYWIVAYTSLQTRINGAMLAIEKPGVYMAVKQGKSFTIQQSAPFNIQ